jgi:hypothetical protein
MSELSPLREYKTTASQAPIIIGGTEQQLMELWQERVGAKPPADLSNVLPVQLGKHCEPFIIDWIERTGQHELTERQRFIEHPTLPNFACTLDAYRSFDDAVVEAKNLNPYGDRDQSVAWYTPQVCVQMACRGASRGVLAIMRGFSLEEIEVSVDQAYLDDMWARLAAFQLCCELMREPVHQSPLVPPEQWRTINLATVSPMPNWGMQMIQCMRMWSDTKEAVEMHENSKKGVKELLPDDVGKVTYGDLSVSRSKTGAITIRQRELR